MGSIFGEGPLCYLRSRRFLVGQPSSWGVLLAAADCLRGFAALLPSCLLLWWRCEEVKSNVTSNGTLTLNQSLIAVLWLLKCEALGERQENKLISG